MPAYSLLRSLLFRLDPERAHGMAAAVARAGAWVPGSAPAWRLLAGAEHPALRLNLWGMDLASPIGLAAGFDKDATLLEPMLRLGFGLVEAGSVTPRPQPGNPRPRLFRLPEDEAIINRMGFNNRGVEALATRLERFRRYRPDAVVGVNLGKNKDTPLERAVEDYRMCLDAVYSHASYLVVNVSSPNTPGLRELQQREALDTLARELVAARARWVARGAPRRPLLIKLAPELGASDLENAVGVALDHGLDGLIATNTTLAREGLRGTHAAEQGGLSGRPLHRRAVDTLAALHRLSGGRLTLVGVGGVFSAQDAYDFIRAGATLVQVYTALVYEGPGLARRIKSGLAALLARDGFSSLAQAVGAGTGKK